MTMMLLKKDRERTVVWIVSCWAGVGWMKTKKEELLQGPEALEDRATTTLIESIARRSWDTALLSFSRVVLTVPYMFTYLPT